MELNLINKQCETRQGYTPVCWQSEHVKRTWAVIWKSFKEPAVSYVITIDTNSASNVPKRNFSKSHTK